MNLIHYAMLGWLALLIGCMSAAAMANERTSRQLKPMAEIVRSLEDSGYVVVEAEIDDGHWEVDAHKGEDSYELHIDPTTGKTLSVHQDDADPTPPADSMKLSKLLQRISKNGYAAVVSAEFKRGKWEMEVRRGRQKREIKVDAESGKILSDRIDD